MFEHDLGRWLPVLIETWRTHAGRKSAGLPTGRLTQSELHDVGLGVRVLSAGYTGKRRLAGQRYLDDPSLLGAYLLYFWPISYIEARYCLASAGIRGQSALDLGSGPGAAACALADCGFSSLTVADHSAAALKIAGELLRSFHREPASAVWDAEKPAAIPGDGYACVVLGNVLNELWPKSPDWTVRAAVLVREAAGTLNPDGALCIFEPALRPVTRQLLRLRDLLADMGYPIKSPCFIQGHCPALALPEGTCHTAYRWHPPAFLQELVRFNDAVKEEVTFSYLVVSRKPDEPETSTHLGGQAVSPRMEPGNPTRYRIVSDALVNKAGRTRVFLCGSGGRLSLSAKPGEGYPAGRVFFTLKRGDAILLERAVPRGEGLALGPETEISLLR